MNKKRFLIILLVVVVIIGAIVGAVMTSPSWYPKGTALEVSPSGGTVESGTRMTFTAILTSGKTEIAGNISWSVSGGSLDRTYGMMVVFTAPTGTANESVSVTAKFGGQGVYQPSSVTTQVTVYPAPPAQATATTLKIAPTMFEVHSGGTLVLNTSLSPSNAPSQLITWSINPSGTGSLSTTTGTSVTYTAPTVQANTTVTITASFAGNANYTASSDSSTGSVLPQQVVLKNATVLTVSSSTFTIQSNETLVLNATLSDASGNVLSGKTITWSISPSGTGSLSSTTGTSVTYTASTVQANTTVTITASFAGDGSYVGSSDSSTGTVTALPAINTSDLYVMTFVDALMTNVKFEGPVMMNGTSVTMVSADIANMTQFTLSHMNLNVTEMDVTEVQWYATYVNFSSDVSSKAIVVTGGQTISLGPISFADYDSGTIYVVQWLGTGAAVSGLQSVGEYTGGNEPYVPNEITTPECDITQGYRMDGPVTYSYLTNMAATIAMGKIDIHQFSFEHPITYTLDRQFNKFTSTNRWQLKSTSAIAYNVTAYMIYFQVTDLGLVTVTATGEENMQVVIPHGFEGGQYFTASYLTVHAVYFTSDYLTMTDFILTIE